MGDDLPAPYPTKYAQYFGVGRIFPCSTSSRVHAKARKWISPLSAGVLRARTSISGPARAKNGITVSIVVLTDGPAV